MCPLPDGTLLEMRKDTLQRDLPALDDACARYYCLHQRVEAPDLATIKDFFSLSHRYELRQDRGEATVDSITTNVE